MKINVYDVQECFVAIDREWNYYKFTIRFYSKDERVLRSFYLQIYKDTRLERNWIWYDMIK